MLTRLFWSMAWMFYIYYRSVSPALPETFCRLCVYKYSDCYIEKLGIRIVLCRQWMPYLFLTSLALIRLKPSTEFLNVSLKYWFMMKTWIIILTSLGTFLIFLIWDFSGMIEGLRGPVSWSLLGFTYSKLFYLTLFIFFIIVTEVLSWSW